jgi:hypothetical protein
MELEKDKGDERSERGRRRDSETGTASESKTKLALPRQGIPIYVEGRKKGSNVRDQPA